MLKGDIHQTAQLALYLFLAYKNYGQAKRETENMEYLIDGFMCFQEPELYKYKMQKVLDEETANAETWGREEFMQQMAELRG